MTEYFAQEDDWENHPKKEFEIELDDKVKEYKKILQLNIEKLEEFAHDLEMHALEMKNLQERYNYWNSAKRILKITELIRKEKESNEQ